MLHDCPFRQRDAATTFGALKRIPSFQPFAGYLTTFGTSDTILLPNIFEVFNA